LSGFGLLSGGLLLDNGIGDYLSLLSRGIFELEQDLLDAIVANSEFLATLQSESEFAELLAQSGLSDLIEGTSEFGDINVDAEARIDVKEKSEILQELVDRSNVIIEIKANSEFISIEANSAFPIVNGSSKLNNDIETQSTFISEVTGNSQSDRG